MTRVVKILVGCERDVVRLSLDLNGQVLSTQGVDWEELNGWSAESFGRNLGRLLFDSPTYEAFHADAQQNGERVKIQLHLGDDALRPLPWEHLYQQYGGAFRPIIANANTPFSRRIDARRHHKMVTPSVERVRVLTVISSPANVEMYRLAPIPQRERYELERALYGAGFEVVKLESGTKQPPTLQAIRNHLLQGFHAVHFLCHGVLHRGETFLVLEQENGKGEMVSAERLVEGTFLNLAEPPPLCVLMACHSGGHSDKLDLLPLGPRLIERGGCEAVVSMTYRISMEMARLLTKILYQQLAQHGQIDRALAEARLNVPDVGKFERERFVPVLHTRTEHVWDVQVDPRPETSEVPLLKDDLFIVILRTALMAQQVSGDRLSAEKAKPFYTALIDLQQALSYDIPPQWQVDRLWRLLHEESGWLGMSETVRRRLVARTYA